MLSSRACFARNFKCTRTRFRKRHLFLSKACCHSERSRELSGLGSRDINGKTAIERTGSERIKSLEHWRCLDFGRHDKRQNAPHNSTWLKFPSITPAICIATQRTVRRSQKFPLTRQPITKGKGKRFRRPIWSLQPWPRA